jgi:predicted nicotinamide N-methyase
VQTPFSLEQFHRQYETESDTARINGRQIRFLKPKSIDRFLDSRDILKGFPLWAKVWEASLVLAGYMADRPVAPDHHVLELGAGLGLAGITAAMFGHRVTLTEYDPHALNFLQANIALNGCPHADARHLDWNQPLLDRHFDLIIGSEIVYKTSDIDLLLSLFQRHLKPGGQVVLAEAVRASGKVFWEKMSPFYHIRARKHTLRSEGAELTVVLFEMQPTNR